MTRRPPIQREDVQQTARRTAAVPGGPDSLLCQPTRNTGAGLLPDTLEALAGPGHGLVDLPLHIAWSGLRAYDLDRPRQRMSLYRTVLAEGQCDDITCFLNRDLLLTQDPRRGP